MYPNLEVIEEEKKNHYQKKRNDMDAGELNIW